MTQNLFLVGGGRDENAAAANYALFLDACEASRPRVACVVMDDSAADEMFDRLARMLGLAGSCEQVPVLIPSGGVFNIEALAGCDAMLVGGGLTPAYAAALAPAAPAIRTWLSADGRPYAGFSAGAAIAATRAVVGGWLLDGIAVCHEDCAEGLDELCVVDGLGLVPFALDVHCAQHGTLSRLVAAVRSRAVVAGIGLDENTMLSINNGNAVITGLGRAWLVTESSHGEATVCIVRSGERIGLPASR